MYIIKANGQNLWYIGNNEWTTTRSAGLRYPGYALAKKVADEKGGVVEVF